MADPDYESIPLLQLGAFITDEEDLDDSRETETTDDECREESETGDSHLEQPGSSDQSNMDDKQQNSSMEHEKQPLNSFRHPNDHTRPQCSDEEVESSGSSCHSYNYDQHQSSNIETVAGPSGLCRHLNSHDCPQCSETKPKTHQSYLERSSSSSSSQSSSHTLLSQLKIGQEAVSYFAGEAPFTSSSDSHKVSSGANSVDLGCVIEYTLDEDGNIDYVDIDFDDTISENHIVKLCKKVRLNHYTSISCEGDFTLSKCRGLFERDFYCEVIENPGGSLSQNYPARLIIPIARKIANASSERMDAAHINTISYHGKVKRSVFSRLLTRFVVPVILFDEKFICRSGSLTVRKTAVFESARQKEVPKDSEITAHHIQQIARKLTESFADISSRTRRVASHLFFPNSMAKLRDIDAEIIRDLNIRHICDLMVEVRKMFKQTIRISSSEKINRQIFKDSAIEQMPYPGCSFFRRYHDADHVAHRLVYDWERPDVNVGMQFSVDPYDFFPDINWANYKEWDIVDLTRNYLKMILLFLAKDDGGLLIHCISGWDRTPLFISLIRVSLWADGLVHESLDYREMAYLTLAYDWYLFGHNFPRRYAKKQEILHFCFNFLLHIATDEFSITKIFHELPAEAKWGRSFPPHEPEKRGILKFLRAYVLDVYGEYITKLPTLN